MNRLLLPPALVAASVLVLVGCATPSASNAPPGPGQGAVGPAPPEGEVVTQGMVMDVRGSVELCLGAVAESYPPQCSGLPLEGWSWRGVEGFESSGDITWGTYAVQGTYDGDAFTLTQPPIMLALYDPMAPPDPTGGEPGAGTEEQLAAIQTELPERLGETYLASFPENGWLWVDVVWDDGTWQDAADAEYGEGVVIIRSALRAID